MDRYAFISVMLLFVGVLVIGLRQELINTELKQQNALQREQIVELQKKQRLTAQDVGMIEKLIIEGKQ